MINFTNVPDLQETNEELQAQMLTRSLEEGRNLLTGVGNGNSLAEELEAMSAQEVGAYHSGSTHSTHSLQRSGALQCLLPFCLHVVLLDYQHIFLETAGNDSCFHYKL